MAHKELKDRIKALREKQGIWQAELARRIGSSVNGFAQIEKGRLRTRVVQRLLLSAKS